MEIPEDNHITFLIMAIIAVVSLIALKNKKVFEKLLLHPATVIHYREYHRVITSALVHNNLLHLGLNLFMLYVFCSGIEEMQTGPGRSGLLLIAGSGLLGGSLFTLWINRKMINYSTTGASGIVFGTLCSYLVLNPYQIHLHLPVIGGVPDVYIAVGYLAILVIYSQKYKAMKIDYFIHIGGAIGGLLTTFGLYYRMIGI